MTTWRNMRFTAAEASGGMGDLGTFIPLVISLVSLCHLDLGSVLLFAGLCNIVTGILFNQPIPVQPMKAIAAVAIAESLTPGAIAAAGLGVGLIVLVLALTGLVEKAERKIPIAVVRGIQLGVGLNLLLKGFGLAIHNPWGQIDGPLLAIAGMAFVIYTFRKESFPSAMYLFLGGIFIMLISDPHVFRSLARGWNGFQVTIPSGPEWADGLIRGAIPQLPLTLLNSVIAVCALSSDLYPGRGISTKRMATSVGLMNLFTCWLGAMPMCHGSGGLAGQHRFGARTGGSVVMLGGIKVAIAITMGTGASIILMSYPVSLLGVLLIFAGYELGKHVTKCKDREAYLVAGITGAGCVFFNTTAGFVAGLVCAVVLRKCLSSKS